MTAIFEISVTTERFEWLTVIMMHGLDVERGCNLDHVIILNVDWRTFERFNKDNMYFRIYNVNHCMIRDSMITRMTKENVFF